MQKDERNLLEVLKSELAFINHGGYRLSPLTPWRPRYIFEDSFSCMNYECKDNRGPCSDCVLMDLVPVDRLGEKIPCRHIPFNDSWATLDSLYRYSDQQEIEKIVTDWLRRTIVRLEEERLPVQGRSGDEQLLADGPVHGSPLYQKLNSKCANPACPTPFVWKAGGKFFRFRPDTPLGDRCATVDSPQGVHGVRHYWLCERCVHTYTLVYRDFHGVLLMVLWPDHNDTSRRDKSPAV